MEAASVTAWMALVRMGWEVALREESGVKSEASKRGPVVGIHDRGEISEGGRPTCLRCCCASHVARESTDVPVEQSPAYQRSAVRHRG